MPQKSHKRANGNMKYCTLGRGRLSSYLKISFCDWHACLEALLPPKISTAGKASWPKRRWRIWKWNVLFEKFCYSKAYQQDKALAEREKNTMRDRKIHFHVFWGSLLLYCWNLIRGKQLPKHPSMYSTSKPRLQHLISDVMEMTMELHFITTPRDKTSIMI